MKNILLAMQSLLQCAYTYTYMVVNCIVGLHCKQDMFQINKSAMRRTEAILTDCKSILCLYICMFHQWFITFLVQPLIKNN